METIGYVSCGLLSALNLLQIKKGWGTPLRNTIQFTVYLFLFIIWLAKSVVIFYWTDISFISVIAVIFLSHLEAFDLVKQEKKKLNILTYLLSWIPVITFVAMLTGFW